jgi:hypothetical protein
MSNLTASLFPPYAAACNGLQPAAPHLFTSAWFNISNVIGAGCPRCAAADKAVAVENMKSKNRKTKKKKEKETGFSKLFKLLKE